MLPALRSTLALALAAAFVAGLSACGTPRDSPPGATLLRGKLVLTGSSTVAPLAGEIGRRFEEANPGTRIDVQTGGSSRGIADVRSGVADIGMASRTLASDEQDLVAHTLARDGVCLVVHADNPLASLDFDQVVAIYTGAVSDWSEVGGEPGPITVVSKAAGRATLEVFLDHFGIEAEDIQADVIIGDNQQGLKTVAAAPGSIAYISIGAAEHDARAGQPVKLVAAGGVAPTTTNVATGLFPITRPLSLLTRGAGSASPLASAFLAFALSDRVHDLIETQLFVPVPSAVAAEPAEGTEGDDSVRPG